jgi:predicted TIM-barrel fold metal-dependent hydrolase
MIRKAFKIVVLAMLILVALALIARWLLFKGPVQAPQTLPDSPIIDMHVHIAGLGYGDSGCFVADVMKDSYKFDYYLGAFGVDEALLKQEGDQVLVQRLSKTISEADNSDGVVILALDGVVNEQGELDLGNTQVYIPNDYVAEQARLYPNVYFGASINPYRHDALAQLEQVKQQGAKLIKWIPNIQHIDPSDSRLTAFYLKMKALDMPLLSHAGQERSFADAIDEYGDPKRLALPLSLGVKVIAGHIATTGESHGEDNYQRILTMFEAYPNLYTDISSLTQINKLGYINKALVDSRLQGRLVYGSDFPLVNMALVSPYYFPLNLTFQQMRSISRITNPFERDIALKQALGLPSDIFARSALLLNIAPENESD